VSQRQLLVARATTQYISLLQPLGVKSRIQNFDEADGKIGTKFDLRDTSKSPRKTRPVRPFPPPWGPHRAPGLPLESDSEIPPATATYPGQWGLTRRALFLICAIEKPAFGYPAVSGIFVFYAVHIPDNDADAHRNEGHTNYRLGWALS